MTQRNTEPSDGNDRSTEQGQPREGDHQEGEPVDEATKWFASAAVRGGLTIIGVVLVLFALGQAVGFPLLELVAEALTSQTGQWLVVAFFGILLIAAARKGIPTS